MTAELLPPDVPEADHHAPTPDLEALSPARVEAMRDMQRTQISVARQHALSEHDVATQGYNTADAAAAAETEAIGNFDRDIDEFVHNRVCSRDDNPEVHGRVVAMLRNVSVDRMDDEEWYLGEASEPTEEGGIPLHNNLDTSGKSRHQAAIDALRTELGLDEEEEDDDSEGEDDTEEEEDDDEGEEPLLSREEQAELDALPMQIDSLRTTLARLSVERRRLMTNRGRNKNRDLDDSFRDAESQYRQALLRLSELRGRLRANLPPEYLQSLTVQEVIDEHTKFTNAELRHMEQDNSKKWKITRWLADHKIGTLALSTGTGVALGATSKLVKTGLAATMGAGSLAVAAPAVLGIKAVGAIYRGGTGNQVALFSDFDNRRTQDKRQLRDTLNHDATYSSLFTTINGRVEQDQRSNRRRVIGGVALGAVGFGVGLVAGELISNLRDGNDGSTVRTALTSRPEVKPTSAPEITSHPGGHPAPDVQTTVTSEPTPGSTGAIETGQDSNHDSHGENESTSAKANDENLDRSTSDLNANATVEADHGITDELQDLAEQEGVNLTGAEAWEAYQHLNETVGGNLFTDNETYRMDDGNLGIANTGATTWDPRALEEFERWLAEQHPEKVKSSS